MGNSEGAPAIAVRGLRIVRGANHVIEGLDLTVPTRQVVGLLGPSGSGKTTLMRAIVGAQIVAGGTIDVFGQPAGTAPLRRRVGYTTQTPSVYPDLTVGENLRYAAAILRVDDERVTETLGEVDLAGFGKRIVRTLSGGELSRVSLAVTLLGKPDLLVLDEPTVGLDPVLRRDLWDLFHRLRDGGASLLVSSHVMDEAVRCDRLLLMRGGAILADGTLPELLERTGAVDAEGAFLHLVDEAVAAEKGGAAA